MKHTTPTTAIHGEEGSVRIVARVVSEPEIGMPKVVVDIGDVKGIPLTELQKIEDFATRVYDWRRTRFIERRGK